MKKSYIAENIIKEYKKKKRHEENKRWSELQNFKKENCFECKNKTEDLCDIRRNIDGKLNCTNKE